MLIDFHSHVLPGIDDGAADLSVSLELVASSAKQGVGFLAATPHFYPYRDDFETFFQNRERAWKELSAALPADSPNMLLGAEVGYFKGISKVSEAESLGLGNTGIILLEMPFSRWDRSVLSEVVDLHQSGGVTVLIAHIERYIAYQKDSAVRELRNAGICFQSNAEFFLHKKQKTALRMLERGVIGVLGSDCHNMTDRKPNMGEAVSVITAAFGESAIEQINARSENLLSGRRNNELA